jgi:hypothetical protein
MRSRSLYFLPCILLLAVAASFSALQAGSVCAQSNVISVETRALGVCAESAVISVDTRTRLDLWLAQSGLADPMLGAAAIPFHDGVTNLQKYAFNLNPAQADARGLNALGNSGLPRPLPPINAQRLRVETLRRKDDPALTYRAEFSLDASNWLAVTTPTQITQINSIWEKVIFEAPTAPTGRARQLGRVKVSYTPSP